MMEINANLNSILDEEEAVEFLGPRKQKSRSWLKFGVPSVGVASVVVLAFNYAAGVYPFQPSPTPLERIVSVHHAFMKAFTARALRDAPDFTTSMEVYLKQTGQDDPSAMTLNAKVHYNKGSGDWPEAMLTVMAQPGKQAALVTKLEEIKDFFTGKKCDGERRSPLCGVEVKKSSQSDHFGKGEFVLLTMALPKDGDGKRMDADMMKSFAQHKPEIHADIFVGRTIEEMYNNKNDNIAILPKGIGMKASAVFASSLFEALADITSPDADKGLSMLKGLAMVKGRVDLEYKKGGDLHNYFDDIPTLTKAVDEMKRMVQRLHPHLNLNGLDDLCAGVKGGVIAAGMDDFEIVVTMYNFDPTPVLTSMVSRRRRKRGGGKGKGKGKGRKL